MTPELAADVSRLRLLVETNDSTHEPDCPACAKDLAALDRISAALEAAASVQSLREAERALVDEAELRGRLAALDDLAPLLEKSGRNAAILDGLRAKYEGQRDAT